MPEHRAPEPPPLARAGIDRAADERSVEGLVDLLRGEAATRVVAVHGDRGLVEASGSRLHLLTPDAVGAAAEWAFLGRDAQGAVVLLAVTAADAEAPAAGEQAARWRALREVGGALDPIDAGLLVEAVSLGRWLVDAPYCSACGARTVVRAAGWARHCLACGREHFPRTDPAVIVAVQSADGERLLLGKNALWAGRNMYSTFAGFVEAGESLESTVAREVLEEAGIALTDVRYRGSQSWPYPRSLMLGFHATAVPGAEARGDGEEIVDVRWFARDELAEAFAAQAQDAAGGAGFALPGPASIAHRLILDWVERSA
ncbi:NAD(+) diphosphatase [Microbacterium paulum]|nr:NAD(+) diphosphatase [Microbacterium sp.]